MGYINMGGKKLTMAVAVVAMIAAGKGSMAMTPPAVSEKCVYDLAHCVSNDPSSLCCDVLSRIYHNDYSCFCTYLIIPTNEATRMAYLAKFAACEIGVPSNLCLPGPPPPPPRKANIANKIYCTGLPGFFTLFLFLWSFLA